MRILLYIVALLPKFSIVFGSLIYFDEMVVKDFMTLLKFENARIMSQERHRISTLRYVHVITRHGSRSPTFTYPTDPYPPTNLQDWPDGYNQLTKYGKQQMFLMGRLLRQRYNGFLSAYYSPNDTFVVSENKDRILMSSAILLAGLYPPVGFQVWNTEIPWQPVPIAVSEFDISDIASRPTMCPKFAQAQVKAEDELNKRSSEYADLLEYLSENMRLNVSVLTLAKIWNTLILQEENGLKLPAWSENILSDRFRQIAGRVYQVHVSGSYEQIQLLAGPLLQQVSDQLNKKASGKLDLDLKLYIHAAHDVTLRAILSGLGIHDAFPIESSAYIVFELHKESTGYNVKVMYFNNGAITHPTVLNMLDCPNPCSLEGFNAAIQKYMVPGDWKEECMKV